MHPSTIFTPLIAAIALSEGADASFIGSAARAGAAAAKAGAQGAAAAGRAVGSGAGRMGGAISNTIKNLPDPVKSGLTSGSVSGTIGGSVGLGVGLGNKNNGKLRRAARSQKMYQREYIQRQEKRQELPEGFGPGEAPEGLNQADWDRCYWDGLDAHIVVTGPIDGGNTIQLDGLPSSCMPLNLVLDGNPAGGAIPEPCGSACLKYKEMTDEDYTAFAEIFEDIRTI